MDKKIRKFFKKLFKRKIILVGVIVITLFALMAILAPIISPYDPAQQDISHALAKPSLMHLLGTDEVGRDVFSRIIYGTQVSFSIGIIAVLIAAVFGTIGIIMKF
jgi:peptide/nickel transport system permease protein